MTKTGRKSIQTIWCITHTSRRGNTPLCFRPETEGVPEGERWVALPAADFEELIKKAAKAAAQSFRGNPEFDTYEVLTQLGIGEALISVLDENGSYLGGMIIPGLRVAVDALSSKASQLPLLREEAWV